MTIQILRGPEIAPIQPLRDKTIAVIGFGNQGTAHALNLRDSGLHVTVGNRPNTANFNRAKQSGFDAKPIVQAVGEADLVIIALPDETQPEVYSQQIAPNLRPGSCIGFLHGFCIRYELIQPDKNIGVIMVAPKGPGATLRQRYEMGLGLPCLFAVNQESSQSDAEAIGLAWAGGIGCARAGIILTTFAAETETDLFGEQSVLCGGLTSLILIAFETLVEAGYPPELAYLECCHEAKQVTDLIYERGLAETMKAISNTAEFGTYKAGPILIDESVRHRMKILLQEIQDGTFARAMTDDHAEGFPWFEKQRHKLALHPIEPAGEVIRSLTSARSKPADQDSPRPGGQPADDS